MHPDTAQALLDLNQRFYTEFGASFAATRRRIQPGVRQVLSQLPDAPQATWLDLGCGSGSLAVEWLRMGRKSAYVGMDYSRALLDEAQKEVSALQEVAALQEAAALQEVAALQDTAALQEAGALPNKQRVSFFLNNLAEEGWETALSKVFPGGFTGIVCFAVLHHVPSRALRARVLRQAASLLPAGGLLIHSVWQFQHSPKLMARRASWDQIGLSPEDLEPGDTLLDWRAEGPNQPGKPGLRYVHLFDPAELDDLAHSAGFQVTRTFESDGQNGRLGLYQVWTRQ